MSVPIEPPSWSLSAIGILSNLSGAWRTAAQPAIQPEHQEASLLGALRAARSGGRLTAFRWASEKPNGDEELE